MIYIDGACYYYRNKAAQKEDNKTMYRYINYIYKNRYGNYVIKTADNVTRQYVFYSLKEAIKKANNDYRERKQQEWLKIRERQIKTYGYVWDPAYMTDYEKKHKKEIRGY